MLRARFSDGLLDCGAVTELQKLDPIKIRTTAEVLRARISERFPNAGLLGVADQLVELASRAGATCKDLARPNWRVRIAIAAVIVLLVAASVAAAVMGLTAAETGHAVTWAELVQVAEAGANDLVLLGAAIYFFISFETRYKRGKVVKALHQLRTLAHLIDAHQLTKTPEVIGHDELRTPSSPERKLTAFELGRYLDYCSEMLSLTGKIAALYGDGFDDADSLEAVNEIEEITVGLQGKIWQKLILLHAMSPTLLSPSGAVTTPVAAPAVVPIAIAGSADLVTPIEPAPEEAPAIEPPAAPMESEPTETTVEEPANASSAPASASAASDDE